MSTLKLSSTHISYNNKKPRPKKKKMVRQLVFTHIGSDKSGFSMGVAGAGLSLFVCAAALLMCASHSRKWRQWRACYEPDTDDTDRCHVIHHVEQGGRNADVEDEDVSVWQKNILMGGKCQLPDFSGVIIYDSDGTVVTPAKTSRLLLTWK